MDYRWIIWIYMDYTIVDCMVNALCPDEGKTQVLPFSVFFFIWSMGKTTQS